jgi:hypothetical protein
MGKGEEGRQVISVFHTKKNRPLSIEGGRAFLSLKESVISGKGK